MHTLFLRSKKLACLVTTLHVRLAAALTLLAITLTLEQDCSLALQIVSPTTLIIVGKVDAGSEQSPPMNPVMTKLSMDVYQSTCLLVYEERV